MRVTNEQEALTLIDKFRDDGLNEGFEVTKATYINKTKKSKGEVIDSWTEVTITITYMEI